MTSIEAGQPILVTESGRRFRARQVVLATGHDTPELPSGLVIERAALGRVIPDPWAADGLARLTPGANVLCIGTGLTFVDVTLSVVARDIRCTVHGISRTGAVPYAHEDPWRPPYPAPPLGPGTKPAQVAAWVEAFGPGWRRAIDALRPVTQKVWRSWDDEARREFMSVWSRRWEVRRHRMAPAVGREFRRLRNAGRVTTGSGGVSRIGVHGDRLLVTSGEGTTRAADQVVICTGPAGRPGNVPLLAGLERSGLVIPGPLGLGLSADPVSGQVRLDAGKSEWLSCIGPLLRGELYESIAIPELRCQARDVAAGALRRLTAAPLSQVVSRPLRPHPEQV